LERSRPGGPTAAVTRPLTALKLKRDHDLIFLGKQTNKQ
jgi:hypothetical protein